MGVSLLGGEMYNVGYFELMNKDKVLAILEVNRSRAYITKTVNKIPNFIQDINDWVDIRTSPVLRENISNLLKFANIHNKVEYLSVTYGISLTDTLWVRKVGDDTKWRDISPYTNKFSKIIGEIALNCNYRGGKLKSPSPDYTVDGTADKCWKRENGIIYLYKTSGEKWSGITGNRPYMEYYANQVAERLFINKHDFIKYDIKVRTTDQGYKKAYVRSPIFTSERYGFLPMWDSRYRGLEIVELDKIMDAKSRIILREMILLDSIILNYDRHMGNYGFMYDNESYKIQGMSPVFDNDCSLGHNISLNGIRMQEAFDMTKKITPKTSRNYDIQGKWALTSELATNMKNMYPFKFKRLSKDIDIEDKRVEFMEFIVNNQIKSILS